jgi:cell division topological specificity factor MinE
MWNEIKGLFFVRRSTREEAIGRLQLVLARDRAGIDGAKLQEMRAEIAAVIAKYVEIDVDSVAVQIERVSRESTQLKVSSPLRAR